MSSEVFKGGVHAGHGLQSLLWWLPSLVIPLLVITKTYFFNSVLSFRLGELARAFLLIFSSLIGASGLSQEGQIFTEPDVETRRTGKPLLLCVF